MANIGLVLLGAGGSTRMGSPKQMLPFQGTPLIRYTAEIALESRCTPVIVVLGSFAEQIRPVLEPLPVEIVENPAWEDGMASSIHAGVKAASERRLDGVILSLADQPLVSAEILNRLVEAHLASGQPLVASRYAGTVGVPVFFSKELFGSLLALRGNQGCKGVILAHMAQAALLECPEAEMDVDTPEDYERAQRGFQG